jgi:hypothetical protein
MINNTMIALMSGSGNIILSGKKSLAISDALAIKSKNEGHVDLSGLQYIALQIDENTTILITPDNFSHWRKQIIPFWEAIRKS